PKHGAR
ncbi:exodeoxyribonuclease V, 67 kDa subunit domain protein, partial [Vibrio cholerae O1 str. AG-8040]